MTFRYAKPTGYATYLNGPVKFRKPWNGYNSGDNGYAPGRYSFGIASMTFSAAPANGSQITVQDGLGAGNLKTFTYTYSGAPGAGIIPLVAGGGTAAQAATATQLALAAQLTQWTASNPSSAVAVITSRVRGTFTGPGSVGTTNITFTNTIPTLSIPVPGRFGKNSCWMGSN